MGGLQAPIHIYIYATYATYATTSLFNDLAVGCKVFTLICNLCNLICKALILITKEVALKKVAFCNQKVATNS